MVANRLVEERVQHGVRRTIVAFVVAAGFGFGALFEPVFGVLALVAVGTGVVLALIGMNPVNPALRRVWALARGIVVLIGSVTVFGAVGRGCSGALFGSHSIFNCGLPPVPGYGPGMDLGKASPQCLESSFDHPYQDPAGRFSVTFPGKPQVISSALPGGGPTVTFYDVDNEAEYWLSLTTSGCRGSAGLPSGPATSKRDEMFMGRPSRYEFYRPSRTSAEEAECRAVFVGHTTYVLVVHSDPKNDLGLVFDPQHLDPQQERVLSTAAHDNFDRFARSLRIRSETTNCGGPGDPGRAPTCLSSFEHPYSDPSGRFSVSFPVTTPSPATPSGGGCDLRQVGVADLKSFSLYEVDAATWSSRNIPLSKRIVAADQKWMLNEPFCAGGPATIKRYETFRGHLSLYEFHGHSRTSSEETECRTVLVGRTTYHLSVTFDPQQTHVPSATLHINFSRFVGTLRIGPDRRR